MGAANRRYLDFLSAVDDPTTGIKNLENISSPARDGERSWRGFNLFHGHDLDLFQAVVRGEHTIIGFHNLQLRSLLGAKMAHRSPACSSVCVCTALSRRSVAMARAINIALFTERNGIFILLS
jgi:hypothetical protein